MAEIKEIKTMLAAENQQEAEEVMMFLGELAPEEKKDFLVFMQGIRFAKVMTQKTTIQQTLQQLVTQ